MNKHILTVMKWLDDPNSVSQKERAKNRCEAYVAYWTACATYATTYDEAHAHATHDASTASYAAYISDVYWATRWVDKYFKRTGENSNDYRRELNK